MPTKGPAAADLHTTLTRQVEALAQRLRAFTGAEWAAASANPGWSNADVAFHLGDTLAAFVIGVEHRGDQARPAFPALTRPPDAHLPALLTAQAERLVELLAGTEPSELVWHPYYRFSARSMAAVALAEVVLHRWDVTGPGERGPEARAARLILQGLFASQDDSGASPAGLLLHVTGRQRMEARPGWQGAGWQWELLDEVAGERLRP